MSTNNEDKTEVIEGELLSNNSDGNKLFKKNKLNNALTTMFDNADIPMKKEEFNWEDVESIYNAIANGVVEISIEFNNAIATIVQTEKYEKDIELIAVVNTFKNDLLEFTNVLEVIKNKKGSYTGIINNEDELALNLEIFNDLLALYDKFKSIIQPHMLEVTDRIVTINIDLKKQQEVINNE